MFGPQNATWTTKKRIIENKHRTIDIPPINAHTSIVCFPLCWHWRRNMRRHPTSLPPTRLFSSIHLCVFRAAWSLCGKQTTALVAMVFCQSLLTVKVVWFQNKRSIRNKRLLGKFLAQHVIPFNFARKLWRAVFHSGEDARDHGEIGHT